MSWFARLAETRLLSADIIDLHLVFVFALALIQHSDTGIHKVGLADPSKRYLPLGLHVDDPPAGLCVDHPLDSVSALITRYCCRRQDLFTNARDELAVQREPIVRDRLQFLLTLGFLFSCHLPRT